MYKGIGASAGIGIGKIVKIKEEELNYTKQSIEDTEDQRRSCCRRSLRFLRTDLRYGRR